MPELASIPFGVLLRSAPPGEADPWDLRGARWLIRDFSFTTVISAQHYLATKGKPDDGQIHRPLLAVGDPKLDVAKLATTEQFRHSARTRNGLQDFQELPETADEVRAVAKLFGAPDVDILLGERGTEEAFRSRPLAEYDVIHFATHGLIKAELAGLSDSALLLTPGLAKDAYDDGLLTATEISRLRIPAKSAGCSGRSRPPDLLEVGHLF
jgi:CHAT domain-containing protein